MAKSLLYRLFGAGKIPAPLMSQLNAEGIILFDEGVKGSVTYRNFRAPGKRFSWRRQGFAGSNCPDEATARWRGVLKVPHKRTSHGRANS